MAKSPSPSGRGQGEGLKIRKDFSLGFALSGSRFARPSPGAPARWLSRRPLLEEEGLVPDSVTRSQRGEDFNESGRPSRLSSGCLGTAFHLYIHLLRSEYSRFSFDGAGRRQHQRSDVDGIWCEVECRNCERPVVAVRYSDLYSHWAASSVLQLVRSLDRWAAGREALWSRPLCRSLPAGGSWGGLRQLCVPSKHDFCRRFGCDLRSVRCAVGIWYPVSRFASAVCQTRRWNRSPSGDCDQPHHRVHDSRNR